MKIRLWLPANQSINQFAIVLSHRIVASSFQNAKPLENRAKPRDGWTLSQTLNRPTVDPVRDHICCCFCTASATGGWLACFPRCWCQSQAFLRGIFDPDLDSDMCQPAVRPTVRPTDRPTDQNRSNELGVAVEVAPAYQLTGHSRCCSDANM